MKQNKKLNIVKVMKEKETKFTIFSILVVLILLVSSSYAIFSSVQKAQKYNSIKVGNLVIDFTDTEDGLGNVINLNRAYPTSDEEGQKTTPYIFKIKNIGSITASYTIKLQDDIDMITEDNCSEIQLDKSRLKYSLDGEKPKVLSTQESTSYTIETGSLVSGETKTYSLKIWINEVSGNEVLGKHYHGKIVVEGVNAQETPNEPVLDDGMIPIRY